MNSVIAPPAAPPRAWRRAPRVGMIAGGLLLLVPLLSLAADPPGDGGAGGWTQGGPGHPGEPGKWGPMRGPHGGWGQGSWDHHEHGPRWELHPRFLRGLKLTEDQQDKIFAIEHNAEPALRDSLKALHKAREGLRGASTSDSYNESEVKAMTEAAGRAMSQMSLLKIRSEHEIYALLTPSQHAEIAARRARWKEHGWSGHGDMHGGPGGPWQGRGPGRDGMPAAGPPGP